MKLHWSPRSPYVRKVMIAAHETGVVGRIETVRSVTSMLKPNLPLMLDNPWSKIPTLITDEGLVLFDSDVIVEYLDSLHMGPKLHPVEPELRWRALRWRAFGSEMLNALILWRNERERPAERQLAVLLEAFAMKMSTGLKRLEAEVPQLAAAPFGVGHIAIGCALSYADLRFESLTWRDGHPALAAWHAEFMRRPSAVATEPFDDRPRGSPIAAAQAGVR
jgi:glutathione S-transferase